MSEVDPLKRWHNRKADLKRQLRIGGQLLTLAKRRKLTHQEQEEGLEAISRRPLTAHELEMKQLLCVNNFTQQQTEALQRRLDEIEQIDALPKKQRMVAITEKMSEDLEELKTGQEVQSKKLEAMHTEQMSQTEMLKILVSRAEASSSSAPNAGADVWEITDGADIDKSEVKDKAVDLPGTAGIDNAELQDDAPATADVQPNSSTEAKTGFWRGIAKLSRESLLTRIEDSDKEDADGERSATNSGTNKRRRYLSLHLAHQTPQLPHPAHLLTSIHLSPQLPHQAHQLTSIHLSQQLPRPITNHLAQLLSHQAKQLPHQAHQLAHKPQIRSGCHLFRILTLIHGATTGNGKSGPIVSGK